MCRLMRFTLTRRVLYSSAISLLSSSQSMKSLIKDVVVVTTAALVQVVLILPDVSLIKTIQESKIRGPTNQGS